MTVRLPLRRSSRYAPTVSGRLLVGLIAGLAVWFVAGVAPAANGTDASATAFAVVVKVPGQDGATAGFASAPPAASASASGFGYPADGSIVTIKSASASAKTGPGAAAHASASARSDASLSSQARSTSRPSHWRHRLMPQLRVRPVTFRVPPSLVWPSAATGSSSVQTPVSSSATGDTRSLSSRRCSRATGAAPAIAASSPASTCTSPPITAACPPARRSSSATPRPLPRRRLPLPTRPVGMTVEAPAVAADRVVRGRRWRRPSLERIRRHRLRAPGPTSPRSCATRRRT